MINNIEVINPIILSPMENTIQEPRAKSQEPKSINQFTAKELKAALAKIESDKDESREAYKELVAETVPKAIRKLCDASEVLSNAKSEVFQFFEDILSLKNEVYGIKETQMSHTFSTDKEEITIGYRVNEGWDDTVTAGIAKVENFITSLSTNEETAILVNIVFNLLKKDAKGNLKGNRVLELQKLCKDFNNDEFTDGVAIIAESYKPVRSVWFIDANLIEADGSKVSIPLSMSSVGFSGGYTFDFFTEITTEDVN